MATKVCRDCELDLPLDSFSRNGRRDGYRRPECRKCQHLRSREINPNYQHTKGAVAARANHTMSENNVVSIKQKKLKEQKHTCVYCGAKISLDSSDLDHKTPLSRGGTDHEENLQALCKKCNKEKHSKTDSEYRAWIKLVR